MSIYSKSFIRAKYGEIFTSKEETAKLCGVTKQTVNRFIKNNDNMNVDSNGFLGNSSLSLILMHYATVSPRSTRVALLNYKKILTIGISGFLEKKIEIKPVKIESETESNEEVPTDLPSALRLYADEVERSNKLKSIVNLQKNEIADNNIITSKSDTYFSVRHARELNPSVTICGNLLTSASSEMKLPVVELFSNYESIKSKTYHVAVWNKVYPTVNLLDGQDSDQKDVLAKNTVSIINTARTSRSHTFKVSAVFDHAEDLEKTREHCPREVTQIFTQQFEGASTAVDMIHKEYEEYRKIGDFYNIPKSSIKHFIKNVKRICASKQ